MKEEVFLVVFRPSVESPHSEVTIGLCNAFQKHELIDKQVVEDAIVYVFRRL